ATRETSPSPIANRIPGDDSIKCSEGNARTDFEKGNLRGAGRQAHPTLPQGTVRGWARTGEDRDLVQAAVLKPLDFGEVASFRCFVDGERLEPPRGISYHQLEAVDVTKGGAEHWSDLDNRRVEPPRDLRRLRFLSHA